MTGACQQFHSPDLPVSELSILPVYKNGVADLKVLFLNREEALDGELLMQGLAPGSALANCFIFLCFHFQSVQQQCRRRGLDATVAT